MKQITSAKGANKSTLLMVFSMIVFFISFADAIMSYVSPIFMEEQLGSTFMMGIIFSFSSVVGLVCDFLFPQWFKEKPHFFFLKVTILIAIAFPFTLMFVPRHILTLLVAMTIWGVYYELNNFSFFEFIHSYMHVNEHAKTWGVLGVFQSLAFVLAPLLAAQLLLTSYDFAFSTVFIFLGFAVFGSIIFRLMYAKKPQKKLPQEKPEKRSWVAEFRAWKILLRRIWPLYLLQLIVLIVDASFWTVGPLFTQMLEANTRWGGFFLTAYMFPPLFMSMMAGKAAIPFGKKRMALLTSSLAGLTLTLFLVVHSVVFFILITFFVSSFLAIAVPEIKATFEDYVSRLGGHGKDMIGIQSSSASVAYIIGPIFATFLATLFDIQTTFGIIGLCLFFISVMLFFIIPRKIRMPQSNLASV